ncbi:sugar transferase [Virgibacillus byunsanensis]|uniref:Sugar transferase n=1 Tax=Virgibacillus byunsanensis TaxID=570945 RepID=A0ABW3LR10_9BACI
MDVQQNIKSKHSTVIPLLKYSLYVATKRSMDISISLLLLVVLAPVILFVLYKVNKKEGKPLFFKQVYVGKHNQEFMMWTFRTMTNTSRVIRALPPHPFPKSWSNGVPSKFTFTRDPHKTYTSTGLWLEKYRLDVLPQLFNVLKGEMSLVGPEPEIPDIADYYNSYQRRRLDVKPGITGLTQLKGFTSKRYDQKIRHDIHYIETRSCKLDLKILYRSTSRLFKTIVH